MYIVNGYVFDNRLEIDRAAAIDSLNNYHYIYPSRSTILSDDSAPNSKESSLAILSNDAYYI